MATSDKSSIIQGEAMPRRRRWTGDSSVASRGVRRFAIGLALTLAAASLAGCAEDAGGSGSDAVVKADVNSADAKEFRRLLGFTDADLENLQGKSFKLGAILPLSGSGANFAVDEGNGVQLAVDAMRKYMGMDVTYTVLDHKSGDPQAGAAAARQLGIDGFGSVINSYYAVFGSTLEALQQYKMLSFDPGGGTGNSLKGQDYFWGFRANTPDDGFYGLEYLAKKYPNAKVALVGQDVGAAYYEPIETHFKEQIEATGMQYTGQVLVPIGAPDYSSVLSKLKDMDPDVVWIGVYGADPGNFMKQYASSGLSAQVVGPEYTPVARDIAGDAYDKYMFAADHFDVANPPNPLSEFFLKTYNDKYGEDPGTVYQGSSQSRV